MVYPLFQVYIPEPSQIRSQLGELSGLSPDRMVVAFVSIDGVFVNILPKWDTSLYYYRRITSGDWLVV